MSKHQTNKKHRPSILGRIERKCDRILSELLILRQQSACRRDTDALIERLHRAARRMRHQCERERDAARRMFNSKNMER